jgi:hypothetical protein
MQSYNCGHLPPEILLNICEYVVNSSNKELNNLCIFRTVCKNFCDVSLCHPLGQILRIFLCNINNTMIKEYFNAITHLSSCELDYTSIGSLRKYIISRLTSFGVKNDSIIIILSISCDSKISFKFKNIHIQIEQRSGYIYAIICSALNLYSNTIFSTKEERITRQDGEFIISHIHEDLWELVIDIILKHNMHFLHCRGRKNYC